MSWPTVEELPELSDHQRQEVEKALSSRVGILSGRPGTGKAQPISELIRTTNGPKRMGDLQVGDFVFGSNDKPIPVTAIWPQGEQMTYKVVCHDGSTARCTLDHLWTVHIGARNAPPTTHTTEELLRLLDESPSTRIYLPTPKLNYRGPVRAMWPTRVALHPYIVGMLQIGGKVHRNSVVFWRGLERGNEHMARCAIHKPTAYVTTRVVGSRPRFWSTVSSRIDPSLRRPYVLEIHGHRHKRGPYTACLTREQIWDLYEDHHANTTSRQLLPVQQRQIPQLYFDRAAVVRLWILRGICDFVATIDLKGRVVIPPEYAWLRRKVARLVWSLGGTMASSGGTKGKKQPIVFRLPRDAEPFTKGWRLKMFRRYAKPTTQRRIMRIVPDKREQCQCISVKAEDGLYQTAKMILTHNTYTVAAITKWLPTDDVALCAFPGKAAARMKEAIAASGGPAAVKTSTIHALLQAKASGGGWRFFANASSPLQYRYYIVDEASMLDNFLLHALLDAMPKDAHVLFVCDTNQLPPIGLGAPLRELIEAGLPAGQLTEIRRNSGRIVLACKYIVEQQQYHPGFLLDPARGENLLHINAASASPIIEAVEDYVKQQLKTSTLANWQVIVPLNEASDVGRIPLNKRIRSLVFDGDISEEHKFRIGDKIICLQNGFVRVAGFGGANKRTQQDLATLSKRLQGTIPVTNGEQAIIIDEDGPTQYIARLQSNGADVVVSAWATKQHDDETAPSWDFAYAISAHKAQGSEWPHVCVVIDPSPRANMVYSREWLYTAISRGKQTAVTIGPLQVANQMCKRSGISHRRSMLKHFFVKGV